MHRIFHRLTVVEMLFRSLKKGLYPKIRMHRSEKVKHVILASTENLTDGQSERPYHNYMLLLQQRELSVAAEGTRGQSRERQPASLRHEGIQRLSQLWPLCL